MGASFSDTTAEADTLHHPLKQATSTIVLFLEAAILFVPFEEPEIEVFRIDQVQLVGYYLDADSLAILEDVRVQGSLITHCAKAMKCNGHGLQDFSGRSGLLLTEFWGEQKYSLLSQDHE